MPELDFKKILADGLFNNEKMLKKYRPSILRAYKNSLDEARSLLGELYANFEGFEKYKIEKKFNRLKSLEKQIRAKLKELGYEDKVDAIFNKAEKKFIKQNKLAIVETFENSYYERGFVFEKLTSMDLGFTKLSPKKIEAAILNPLDKITWIKRSKAHSDKLKKTINEKIAQGFINGKPYSETARELKDVTQKTTGQLIKVVQTEGHRVNTMGELASFDQVNEAAKDLGFEAVKTWNVSIGAAKEKRHELTDLDQQEADENGLFHLGKLTAEGPGLFGIAEEDINCLCYLTFEIKGLSPTIRRDNESGKIIGYKNYNEWAKGKGII
jgi:hypothetical protein